MTLRDVITPPGYRPRAWPDRLWNRVEMGDCWVWQGACDWDGYGLIGYSRSWRVHRLVWELLVGPIPEGMTLDHLCRNAPCVNPDHLEVVPTGVNTLRGYNPPAVNARKTHCPKGHPLAGENIMYRGNGRRSCRTCHRIQTRDGLRRLRERRRAACAS